MTILPHLYVLPVTGPNNERGRTCYVCQLGSAPVVAAFIKPDSDQRARLIEEIQKLYVKHASLQAFVVILGGPDEKLIEELRTLAEARKLTVPLTVLDPEIGLPESIPVNPEADITVLLYRGKQIVNRFEAMSVDAGIPLFPNFSPGSSGKVMALKPDDPLALAKSTAIDSSLGSSAKFSEIDRAAGEMLALK